MKLLFQGDSITDAFRKPEEINPAYQLGNGYVFLIAARLSARFPQKNWEFINRGVSGNKILDLKKRWQKDALDLRPDVMTLLIGVNDTLAAMQGSPSLTDEEFSLAYQTILDEAQKTFPDINLILIEPFLLEVGEVQKSWCEHLRPRQLMIQEVAKKKMCQFIPAQELFNKAALIREPAFWSYDGIHPTHAGFQLLANTWINIFESMDF